MPFITPPFLNQYERIVSVVPSQTELLYSLGLDKNVIGITKFCIYPDSWFRNKTRIGGTKTLNIQKIKSLHPDLIIANKEENLKEQIQELALFTDVFVSDINDLDSSLKIIRSVGELTGTFTESNKIANSIQKNFELLKISDDRYPVAYMIWKDPYMVAGGDTFINNMLEKCGFKNVFADRTRYPAITFQELRASNCKYLLLSSEPFPFKEKHISEFINDLPGVNIILVDGTYFSWYGSRLLDAPAYFSEIILQIEAKRDKTIA